MSLRARVKRLEKLYQRAKADEAIDLAWLRKDHPEALKRIEQAFERHDDVDAAIRALSREDLDILADALDPERRAAWQRWKSVLDQIRPLVDASELPAVERFLRDRFGLDKTAWRHPVVTLRWLSVCPPSLRSASIAAIDGNHTSGPYPWLHRWLWSLADLMSRLPPDVTPTSIQTLAETHIANAASSDRNRWYDVRACDNCGLERPVIMPACLHCAATKCSWECEHIVAQRDWRRLAEVELAASGWRS